MIAICVPCYRGAERLARLLQSMTICDPIGPSGRHAAGAPPVGGDLELLVYDDGSPPEDARAIASVLDSWSPPQTVRSKRLVRGERNVGAVSALRAVTQLAVAGQCDAVLQLDDDVTLPGGFFWTLRSLLAIPNIGVLSWRSRGSNPGQSQQHICGLLQPATELAGYCMAYPRAVFEEVGGIDTRFQFACSDSDFALRVALAGHPCYRVWWPLVPHIEHGSVGDPAVRAETARQDLEAFRSKWGASGQEMEQRALAQLLEGATMVPTCDAWSVPSASAPVNAQERR